jgi:hypothetical protein
VPDEPKTFTQEEVDALIAERNTGLEANRNEALGELKKLKAQLKQYDGVDPDKYKELATAAEEAERKRAEIAGDWKSREAQLVEKFGKEIEGREARIKGLTGALESYLIDAEASKEIASLKGSVKGLLPHIKPHIRVVEQDGKFVSQVVDANGNPRIGDAKGNAMSISQLVEEMRSDNELARLFEGSGSSGGGASKSAGSAGGARTVIAGDTNGFIANLEGIASGKVEYVE